MHAALISRSIGTHIEILDNFSFKFGVIELHILIDNGDDDTFPGDTLRMKAAHSQSGILTFFQDLTCCFQV